MTPMWRFSDAEVSWSLRRRRNPANDNGTPFGRDRPILYIGQSTRREGP